MGILNQQQLNNALQVIREYLSAPVSAGTEPPLARYRAGVKKRRSVIECEYGPLIDAYLKGGVPLADFRSKAASINARHRIWAFNGPGGQMSFNMLLNVAKALGELGECDCELKKALPVPPSEEVACGRIERFAAYVKRLRDRWIGAGRNPRQCPNTGSVLFFLSHFWRVQDFSTWPVYYPNSVRWMGKLGLWGPSGDLPRDFLMFKHVQEELAAEFAEASGEPFDLYRVEVVLWDKDRRDMLVSRR